MLELATLRPSASPIKSRICKKLVLQGHASSSGASYTLFLKVQVPATSQVQVYELLHDPHIQLHDHIVHPLDASGAAPALSTSAATAANSLGIPLSIGHQLGANFSDHTPRGGRSSTSLRSDAHPTLATINRSDDGKIELRTRVHSTSQSKHSTAPQHDYDFYMVTLHLTADSVSNPPFAPFSVRLPVPVCLNNFIRFTVDESIDSTFSLQGMAVEVDPPILPLKSQRKPPLRRSATGSSSQPPSTESFSDDEADITLLGSESIDEPDREHGDTAIVGPFHACSALVIRIAAQQAGDLVPSNSPLRVLSNALRAREAISSITYRAAPSTEIAPLGASESTSDNDAAKTSFDATIELHDTFFPGLDREVQLYVQLGPGVSKLEWRPLAVQASRGILSWSFSDSVSTASSPDLEPKATSKGSSGRSPTSDIDDLVVLPAPSQQGTDDEDLLSVAPPQGLNDANFDYSLDNVAPPSIKQRRFSLQSSSSAKQLPSQPPSDSSDPGNVPNGMLAITFSLLPVLQTSKPLVISVRGILIRDEPPPAPLQRCDLACLPLGLFVPSAVTHAYAQPKLSSSEPEQLFTRSLDQLQDSLEDSRETVQQSQQQEKGVKMLQDLSTTASGDARTEEILRQALAIIAAHNESMTIARHDVRGPASRLEQKEQQSGSNWMLRASHLLWTLLLTAMVLMLFNASQTANLALSAKLDELSLVVQASTRAVRAMPLAAREHEDRTASIFEAVPKAVIVPASEVGEAPMVEARLDDGTHLPPGESITKPAHLEQKKLPWTDAHLSEQEELHPISDTHALSYHVSDWLRDLLRMPVHLVQALLSMFIST